MKLVERHIIQPTHRFDPEIDPKKMSQASPFKGIKNRVHLNA